MMFKENNRRNSIIKTGGNLLVGPFLLVIATVTGYIFKYLKLPETNIAIIYLLAVVAISIFTQRYIISILYSAGATLAFNYFFTAPYNAFEIGNASYLITISIMITVSLIISMLTQRIKVSAAVANQRADENRKMYVMTNLISAATTIDEIMDVSVTSMGELTESNITYAHLQSFTENYCRVAGFDKWTNTRSLPLPEKEKLTIADVHRYYDGFHNVKTWSIVTDGKTVAEIYMPYEQSARLEESKRRVLMVAIETLTMAVDRVYATWKQILLQQENERERYRSSLLRAISHDLRTPLTGIMGTSEMIMGMTDRADERYVLASEIMEDAEWLHSLMENILNLTRLEDSNFYLKKQPEAIEEIIAVVLERFEKRADGRELAVNIPRELMLVPMDAKLIVQVLMNLLDNSMKHTLPHQNISLTVEKQNGYAIFTVTDEGTGIAQEDLPYIFQMYYTSSGQSADSKKGMGLGLAICDAVVKAHGGTISAANREEGGAQFSFVLPMEDTDND